MKPRRTSPVSHFLIFLPRSRPSILVAIQGKHAGLAYFRFHLGIC